VLKYKIIVLLFCFISFSFSKEMQLVPISTQVINYKDLVDSQKYILVEVTKDNKSIYDIRCREYADIDKLKKNKYRAKHYIAKNRAMCKKSLYIVPNNKINFNFGPLEIESFGKVIKETDQYIKIRKPDGKIEKIYKDGSRL